VFELFVDYPFVFVFRFVLLPGSLEALLIIIATCFLYSGIIETHGNYSSYVFIAGQIISLVVNCLDCYELISHTIAEVKHIDFPLVAHFITTSSYIGTLRLEGKSLHYYLTG
jgi:hypothetical protein